MRALVLVFVLAGAGAIASCGGSDPPDGPTGQPLEIVSITPPQGFINEYTGVRISGHGFKTGATVTFGGSLALNVKVIGGNELNVATPLSGIGEADVVVTNPDGETARLAGAFTFVSRPPPIITRLESNFGATAGGTAISIVGDNFRNGVTVTFDGLPGTIYSVAARELYVTVPRHDAGAVDVVVTNADGQTAIAAGGFTYNHPTLTDFNGDWRGYTALEFGISFSIQNDRLISVSCGGVTQTFVPPPSTAAGEFAAVENGRVLITGAIAGKDYAEGVISTDACPTVEFSVGTWDGGARFAPLETMTMRILIASTVLLAGLGFACGHANPDGPTTLILTGVQPEAGITGNRIDVIVTGHGFGSGTTVMIGETRVTVTLPAANRLTGFVSSLTPGTFDVIVTNSNGDVARLPARFSFILGPAPVVTSLSASSGITGGGEWLDLYGTFRQSPTVAVGGVLATMVYAQNEWLFVLTPPHAAGVTDIVVTHLDGRATTLANAFAYTAPWAGDFNGVWNGFGGVDSEVQLQFTIEGDRLTSVKCGTAAARTFATPPVVAGGAFSAAEAGLEITGSLISDTTAGGLIKLSSCANEAIGWRVTRG